MAGFDYDVAILGGGLAGGLVALALSDRRPELRLCVAEAGAHFGGNHVWSFFGSDIANDAKWLVDPLVERRWDGYGVRFPHLSRDLDTPYNSITSERFDAVIRARIPAQSLLTGARVTHVERHGFTLADGRAPSAGVVIDARGATHTPHLVGGWQKFLGQMIRTPRPHGLTRPLVMDARVPQLDGFRFLYALPFSDTELFLEDTYYSTSAALDRDVLAGRLADYAHANGWGGGEILRQEVGCLPVVAGGDFARFYAEGQNGAARIGVGAGLFHPLTGYSLPMAVAMAMRIAALPDLSAERVIALCGTCADQHWRDTGYYRMLARMMFGAPLPPQRYQVFQHFYRLAPALIERFYAQRLTVADRLRVLTGRPPVPVLGAMRSLLGGGAPLADLGIPAHLGDMT